MDQKQTSGPHVTAGSSMPGLIHRNIQRFDFMAADFARENGQQPEGRTEGDQRMSRRRTASDVGVSMTSPIFVPSGDGLIHRTYILARPATFTGLTEASACRQMVVSAPV